MLVRCKLQLSRPTALLKEDSNTGAFPVKIPKFLRASILKNI